MRCLILRQLEYAIGRARQNALVCLKIFWTRERPLVNGLATLNELRVGPRARRQSIVIGHIPTKQRARRYQLR
jgi:hypothetical protein